MEKITPELIALVINIGVIVLLLLGFLLGLKRGVFKATYRFVVSLVAILGLWILLPSITRYIVNFNIGQIIGQSFSYNGFDINTIGEGLEVLTKSLLGFYEQSGDGFVEIATEVSAQDTMLYGLLYGLVEMLIRIIVLIVVIILNWTLYRIIFGIIYLIIKPKKKEKKKSKRLIGGIIGLVNMIAILLLICTPLSGIMSVFENGADILNQTQEEGPINLSFGTEVISLSNENISNINIDNLKPWASIYRKTVGGFIFSINVGDDTELDCALFDSIFSFKMDNTKVAIRKEINTCANALMVIKEDIVDPILKDEEIGIEIIDKLTTEKIKRVFDELSKLNAVDLVVKVGLDSGIYYVQNNKELQEQYVSINDIVQNFDIDEISITNTAVQLGNLSASLFDLIESTGKKPSEIFNTNGDTVNGIVDTLLSVEEDKVVNLINSLADISLIDTLKDIAFSPLQEYLNDSDVLEQFIVLYPKIEVSEDSYIVINGIKSDVKTNNPEGISDLPIKVKDGYWVIDTITTNVNAIDSLYKINIEDIKITDEIRNLSNLYKAFKKLDISSFSQIQTFINSGPNGNKETGEKSIDLSKFTYDNINELMESIMSFKTIDLNNDNLFVLMHNMLPQEYRKVVKKSKIGASDLTALVYSAKLIADTNVFWEDSLYDEEGSLNYTKAHELFTDIKDELAESILTSPVLTSNLGAVCNFAINTFLPDANFDFECIDWNENGKEELKILFNTVNVLLKYGNKLINDFSTLTTEEINEISDVLTNNISKSILLRENINELISIVNNNEAIKNAGFELVSLDKEEWTEEEIRSLFASLKIVVNMLKSSNEEEKDLLLEILKINSKDIDTFLSSKFITKNLVENLISLCKEGGRLYNYVIVSMDRDDPRWYDNGSKNGQLRILLTNAIKLINGVESIEDLDALSNKIIKNIANLSSNRGSDNDEIGDILSSKIIADTLIHYLTNLEILLPDEIADRIIVSNDINWYDSSSSDGELRKLLNSIADFFIDDEGNVITEKIDFESESSLAELILGINDDKISGVLDSMIVLDTAINFIESFNSNNDSFPIFIKNVEYSREKWKTELTDVIIGLKMIALDDGKLIDINGDAKTYVDIISNIDNEDIPKLLRSDIVVDTLAHVFIEMSKEENSVFVVAEVPLQEEDLYWDDDNTNLWREELENIIIGLKTIIKDKDNNSQYDKLVSDDVNDKIDILLGIEDAALLFESRILVDSFAKIITSLADKEEALFVVNDKYRAREDVLPEELSLLWQSELTNIIEACKVIIADKEGNSQYNTLVDGTIDEKMNIITALSDAEIDLICESEIIVDTLSTVLINIDDNEGIITVSEECREYNNSQWCNEIKALVASSKLVFADEEGSLKIDELSKDINKLINKLVNLENKINEEDDQIKVILSSKIITDTIIEEIKKQSVEEDGVLVIEEDIKWLDYKNGIELKPGELRKLFNAIKVLFSEKELELDNIDANFLLDLSDDDIDEVLDSRILYCTIDQKIQELDGNNGLVVRAGLDLNSEVKAIIKSSKILLSDSEGNVDFNDPQFDVEKILHLNAEEQQIITSSVIIVDTITNKLKEMSEDSILVVNENNISDWRSEILEILSILNQEHKPLKKDSNNKYLDNPAIDFDYIYSLNELEINNLMKSMLIVDTITMVIVNNSLIETTKLVDSITSTIPGYELLSEKEKEIIITNSNIWKDSEVKHGEIHKLLSAASILIESEEVNIDKLKVISNEELEKVFDSRIILDTFYREIINLSEEENAVIYLKEGIDLDKDEAIKFVKAIKLVVGSQDITNMDSNEFNVDKFLALDDEEINVLTASTILRYSASKKVYSVLNDGELKDYIELKGSNEKQKLDYIADDLGNLITVMRDLNNDHGISYTDFSFNAFLNSTSTLETEEEKNAKTDAICDTLLLSVIIKDSIPTLIDAILSQSLNSEMYSAINLEIGDAWYDNSGNIGEFKKIMRMLSHVDQFTNANSENNSNVTDANEIAKPLKAMNNSLVLHGIIPYALDKATLYIADWKYTPEPSLSVEEWDEEIDIICDIIVMVNSESFGNLSSLDVKDESFDISRLAILLKLISRSRIINIAHIEEKVKEAIDLTFFNGVSTVTINHVYTDSNYSEKVEAWDAEIDALIDSVEALRNVKDINILDNTPISLVIISDKTVTYKGEENAVYIGEFLNSCKDSKMLSSVILNIVKSIGGVFAYMTDEQILNKDNNWVDLLYNVSHIAMLG